MSLSIGIDGYNIAMTHGTGVATYGVGLADMVAGLGHSTVGIFGFDVGRQRATRELLFFDQFGREARVESALQKRRRQLRKYWPFLPAISVDVPLSDAVEKQGFQGRLPGFDRIVTSAGLFDVAHAHFRRHRRFLTLKCDNPPDIMHWTYPLPIRLAGARNIYTLHDLVPLRLPYATLDKKLSYNRLIKGCVATADHICTVSEASRADIISHFPMAASKITNTYQIAPMPPRLFDRSAKDDAAMIEGMFALNHREYLLFFGALDPKKNIGRMVEAYLTSRSKTPLVVVGGRSWGTDQETSMFGSGNVSLYGKAVGARIIHLDYLPRDLLLRLARGAKAVLFPSLYEGFGLPALEAIRLGTPVIASNTSSLPEVVGEAGLMVNPYDVQAIADAITALDNDPALAARLIAAGPTQIEKFSEAAYRARLSGMYDRVMGQRS